MHFAIVPVRSFAFKSDLSTFHLHNHPPNNILVCILFCFKSYRVQLKSILTISCPTVVDNFCHPPPCPVSKQTTKEVLHQEHRTCALPVAILAPFSAQHHPTFHKFASASLQISSKLAAPRSSFFSPLHSPPFWAYMGVNKKPP